MGIYLNLVVPEVRHFKCTFLEMMSWEVVTNVLMWAYVNVAMSSQGLHQYCQPATYGHCSLLYALIQSLYS